MKHRGVRRGASLISSSVGNAALGELELGPAAHHAQLHWARTARAGLLFQHPQGVGRRRHAFPAQRREVAVQPAANDRVQVRAVRDREMAVRPLADHFEAFGGSLHHLGDGTQLPEILPSRTRNGIPRDGIFADRRWNPAVNQE